MKHIEIKTTQNVIISYELANVFNRFFAWLIDLLIIGVSYVIILVVFSAFSMLSGASDVLVYLIIMPIFFFYALAFEWFTHGYSPGKKMLRIRVVKLNGTPLSFVDVVLRWCFRMVDIYFSLGAIAAALINSTDFSQRIGDIVAHTVVIKMGSGMNISLADIQKIKTLSDYTPVYPGVKKLDESDMLLIKKVLERSNKFDNPAHVQALQMAAQKMARFLELDDVPENENLFLSTCIKDYIVLTR